MYGLYGVGIPVRGPLGFDGRSNIVVLVGGALCRGNASRNGNPPGGAPWEEGAMRLVVDRLSGAGAGARPIPEDLAGGGAGETWTGGAGGGGAGLYRRGVNGGWSSPYDVVAVISGDAIGDEMDSLLMGRRGERTLLGPGVDIRELELKRDSDEILLDSLELLDRGVGGSCFVWVGSSSGCSSRIRDERSVKGSVTTLSGDCKLLLLLLPLPLLLWWFSLGMVIIAAFCSSCSITAAYNISIWSCARRRSLATTDSSMVATLPLLDTSWDLGVLPKLPQDRLKPLSRFGLGRWAERGVTGLGSVLGGGLMGFIISTCNE